ncbi:hypothetical protein CGLO_16091 [Colletotrichum gloeosporioides Cg-14]|uniref:AAA+ ATPase domain-containing protein n=1 Tax=Colletotrichum gloeosporioides (strain Cg-14) TaxID=1237896 RepID=T0LA55_COLGC|nr:hypothetical protein CGLO_16091 [Colletotrichum gloeosporioides Cg-14]
MSTATSDVVDLVSKDSPVLFGSGLCTDDVTHSDQEETLSHDQEKVAMLQRQVADLTKKLEKMDRLFHMINIEELQNINGGTKPVPKGEEDPSKVVKAEEKVIDEKKDKEEKGSLAECKVLYVKPGISWRHKLGEIAAGKLKIYAMLVCYDETKATTTEKLNKEMSPGAIPVSIIINSVRLDQLLQGFSQNLLSEASHVPYIVPRPFKVIFFPENTGDVVCSTLPEESIMEDKEKAFVALYERFKSGLQDMEYTFEPPENTAEDTHIEPSSTSTFRPRSDNFEDDSVRSQQEELMLMRCFIRMCEEHLDPFFKIQSQVADATLERISYQNLWYLFKPGDIIIGRGEDRSDSGDSAEAYCVYCPTSSRPPQNVLAVSWDLSFFQRHGAPTPEYLKSDISQPDDFHLFSYHWQFNGSRFTPQQKLVIIKPFEGEKYITELTYFPKQFCKADNPILKSLIAKGDTFRKLRYGHGVYKGLNVQPQPPQFVDEEVFIDFASGFEANVESLGTYMEERSLSLPFMEQEDVYGRRCDRQHHCWNCDINISVSKLEMKRASNFRATGKYALTVSPEDFPKLSEDNLVMLPRTLLGYGLKSKDWYLLDMYKLKMTETTEDKRKQSFEHLVIPSKTKRLLQALVTSHGITTEGSGGTEEEFKNEIDIVKGKGNGVVIFLYGPPGVGKTSTAETIAAYSNPARPLYAITCGDLGSEAVKIQENLDQHFKLAHRWNCVLLLDEADVYLAERNIHDLDRNGIVSVFLRHLEYYPGILFLTSNREGLIDEAFKSRIHVALRYKAIDAGGTRKIWENILKKIEADNEEKVIKVGFNKSKLLDWAESHFDEVKDKKSDGLSTATWNGRQIRNAFQTAIAIASFERVKLLEDKNVSEEDALKKKSKKYWTIQLKSEHFDTVSKVVGEFEDYLVKCRGDDADRASKSSWRKDSHEPGAPRLSAYPKPKDLFRRSENSSRKGRDEGFADIRGLKGKKPESNDSDDEKQDSNRGASKNIAKSKGWGKQQGDDSSSDSESESSDEED